MYVFSLVSLRFLDVNAAAIENYGYSKEEFLSMTLRDIRPDEDEAYLMEHISILKNAQGTHNMGVFRHKKKSNEIIQVEIKSSNIDYRYERAAIVLANDITDQLNYIQAIERQNETLRDIAWIQSHVVRAPLARVMGLAKIILDFKQENFSLDDINILKMIVESAEELDVIIKEVVEKSNVKL